MPSSSLTTVLSMNRLLKGFLFLSACSFFICIQNLYHYHDILLRDIKKYDVSTAFAPPPIPSPLTPSHTQTKQERISEELEALVERQQKIHQQVLELETQRKEFDKQLTTLQVSQNKFLQDLKATQTQASVTTAALRSPASSPIDIGGIIKEMNDNALQTMQMLANEMAKFRDSMLPEIGAAPPTPSTATGKLQQANRTLVIVMGNLRGGEETWKSLVNNMLDPNNADLALMIGELPEEKKTSSLFSRAKYAWFFKEYDDWADAVDLLMNSTKWRVHLPTSEKKKSSGLWGGAAGFDGSGLIIMTIRWYIAMKIKELGLLTKYDTFVITRSDFFYGCIHNMSKFYDPSSLWVPEGEEYGGFTDRHLVASKDLVLDALDILPPILSEPKKQEWVSGTHKLPKNPEQLLYQSWENKGLNVKQFKRAMFTVATDTDTTRWMTTERKVPRQLWGDRVEGLYLKYGTEHVKAKEECNVVKRHKKHSHTQIKQEQGDITKHNESNRKVCKFKDENHGLCHFIPYGNNFGDEIGLEISIKLIEEHFNCNGDSLPVWNLAKKERKGTCLFTRGSIFHMMKDGDHAWGTGINPFWQKKTVPKDIHIHSVRGPLTENVLNERNAIHDPIGHGDPGLLLPYLLDDNVEKINTKTFCFVSSHVQDLKIVNKIMAERDSFSQKHQAVHVISAKQHWPEVVSSLRQCSWVASSSLHGLIVADAFGIPSRWFQFSKSKTEKTEGYFKYLDYYRSIGRVNATCIHNFDDVTNSSIYWDPIPEETRRSLVENMKATFPYHLFHQA